MSNTEALRQRIADELEREPSDIIGSPSLSVGYVINREINSAIRHYESSRFRWNETRESEWVTTSSGTRTYALPAGFIRMDTLKLKYNNAYITLHPRVWDDLEERDRQVTGASGIPYEYAIYGNILRVYPIPNQSLTLVGSFLTRTRPTSLSGSYCAVVTMGGSSMTATSTASHNNRMDGWTTDGEELIRARAAAAVSINYLRDQDAIGEMRGLLAMREPYLSIRERLAYERLSDEAQDATGAGIIRPYGI